MARGPADGPEPPRERPPQPRRRRGGLRRPRLPVRGGPPAHPPGAGQHEVSWHDRRYRKFRSLDGPTKNLSLAANWVATPTLRLDGALGYGVERPELVHRRNESRWLRAGFRKALPRGFSLGASAQVRWTDYEGEWPPHTPPGEWREDRTRTLSASVHHRRFTLYGFSPQLAVTNEVRTTNAQLYDYRKNSAELRFVRQF